MAADRPAETAPAPDRSRILVVDDAADAREVIHTQLEDRGFRVAACGSVEEALALLAATPFDLVITDLRMPEESGMALIKRLREHTSRQHLPVIVISGHADMDDVSDLLRLQVLDLFRKPIYHVRLLETLNNLFPLPRLQLVYP